MQPIGKCGTRVGAKINIHKFGYFRSHAVYDKDRVRFTSIPALIYFIVQ